jgi:hypothetical protein
MRCIRDGETEARGTAGDGGRGSGYVPYVHSLWGFSKPEKREKKKKKKKCSID